MNIDCVSRKGLARFLGTFIFSIALLSTSVVHGGCVGDLDPTFGTGGLVTTDFAAGTETSRDIVRAVALQCDGKIVVVGEAGVGAGDVEVFAIARYNSDGSLDQTFGDGGLVTTDFFPGTNENEYFADAVAIQCDGKIVVGGTVFKTPDFIGDFLVARYNLDGSLDTTFGLDGDGKVIINVSSGTETGEDFLDSLVIQCDGKIVVAGGSDAGGERRKNDFALARLNPDGSFDATFGEGGLVLTDFATGTEASIDNALAVAIQCDGKIVAVGSAQVPAVTLNQDVLIARYNPDGSLDTTFGPNGDGKIIADFAPGTDTSDDNANAVAIQCDGKIVVAGSTAPGLNDPHDFFVTRYNPDGSLDQTFGDGGLVTTNFAAGTETSTDFADAIAIQCDGKIVVAGRSFASGTSDFAVARYNPDGSLDPTFGLNGDGKVLTDFAAGTETRNDQGFGLAIQCDGKIIVAGESRAGGLQDFAVARLLPGCLPQANAQQSGGTKPVTTKQKKAVVAVNLNQGDAKAYDGQVIDMGSLRITQDPEHGVAVINPDLGTIIYMPGKNFVGTDSFKYTVKDARVCCCCCPCGPCPPCVVDGTEIVGTECLVPCQTAFACSDPATCDPCKHCSDCALESPEATVEIQVGRECII